MRCLKSSIMYNIDRCLILVGGLEHLLLFHILGMSSSQLANIFQRGRLNHQPDIVTGYIHIHIPVLSTINHYDPLLNTIIIYYPLVVMYHFSWFHHRGLDPFFGSSDGSRWPRRCIALPPTRGSCLVSIGWREESIGNPCFFPKDGWTNCGVEALGKDVQISCCFFHIHMDRYDIYIYIHT